MSCIQYSPHVSPDAVLGFSLISPISLFLLPKNPNPHTPILEHVSFTKAGLQQDN